jgi:exopolysaccharide biosynthesis polyprenyl glycosylphosphotransferase
MVESSTTTAESLRNQPQDRKGLVQSLVQALSFFGLWKRRGSLLFASDLAACFASFLIAYYIRFYAEPLIIDILPAFHPAPDLGPYLKAAGLTTAAWILLLARERSYRTDLHFTTGLFFQVRLIIITGLYAVIFLMAISFLFRNLLLSRVVYALGFALSCSLMILVRVGFRQIDKALRDRCIAVYRVLLLGWNSNASGLLSRLQDHNRCTEVIGRLTWSTGNHNDVTSAEIVPAVGNEKDLETVYAHTPFDQLLVLSHGYDDMNGNAEAREALISALNFCEERDISFYMVPDFLDVAVTRQELGSFSGIPVFRLRDAALHPGYAIMKRTMDMAVSALVLVLGMPLWIAIAGLIKATSPGPIFFKQIRVGLHGKPFRMYKFRSMVEDAEERLGELVDFDKIEEPVFKLSEDPRVTPVGKFLRRTSLDETPQMINVLLGSMSLVGPRPEQVELVARYTPWQRRRLKAKPGITGYQQVMSRGDLSLARRIEYDLYYLKFQSLFLDLYILFKTLIVVLRGDGMK